MHELRQRRPEQRQIGGRGVERTRETVMRVRRMRTVRAAMPVDAGLGRLVTGSEESERPLTPHILDEALPADQLHRHEPFISLGNELVQLHEIAMGDVGQRAELALEPQQRVRRIVAQCLDGDRGVPNAIKCLVHHAKGPRPDAPSDLEPGAADEIAAQHVGTCTGIIPKAEGTRSVRR
jgi:hypothetical protein